MKNKYNFFLVALTFITPLLLKAQNPQWMNMSTGMAGTQHCVKALACSNVAPNFFDTVVAGGIFDTAGGSYSKNIALWGGYSWSPMGSGANNEVDAVIRFNNKIYAGGKFDSAGGIHSNYIACWNFTQWDSVLGGLNGPVYAFAVYKNTLYVGGNFTMANGISARRIAKWDGSQWDSVGAGFDTTVFALTVFNDTLYAGGAFTKSNGNIVNYIAKWNGTSWLSLSNGMNNVVYAIDSFSNELYAGGAFTMAGGNSANYIAKWDTARWNPLLTGTNDTIRAFGTSKVVPGLRVNPNFTSNSPYLVAGGNFTTAGGMLTPNIGIWDGQFWDSITSVNHSVYAICQNPLSIYPTVYIGGAFDSSFPAYPSLNYVAQLQINGPGAVNEVSHPSNISIYPNPSNGVFTLQINNENLKGTCVVEIYNMLGEKLTTRQWPSANNQLQIDISGHPAGVYLCRLISGNGIPVGSQKIIIE